MNKKMDHAEYPAKLKTKTWAELKYIMKDAKAAHDAYPDGPNAGYYLDEINYCAEELHARTLALI